MTGRLLAFEVDQSVGKGHAMSSIKWDDHQMVALLAWLETNITLIHGSVRVESMEVPQEAFSGEVDLDNKEFCVYANPENPMADTTLNVFLAYIIALAYDRQVWGFPVPQEEDLVDAHRLVCEAMLDFHPDFSAHLEEHLQILEIWRKAHEENTTAATASTDSGSASTLIDELGSRMFSKGSGNPDDDKWNIN